METQWTIETTREYFAALRAADHQLATERDRRYAELERERERVTAVKQKADDEALVLAREIQHYKDEKANDLRSQIEAERGNYATRDEITLVGEKVDKAAGVLNEKIDRAVETWVREHSILVSRQQEDVSAIRLNIAAQPELRALERSQDRDAGKHAGITAVQVVVFQVITFLIAVGSVIAILIAHG